MTLHDVARAAGVSLATASRVLGGSSRRVAAAYESRVLAAAAQLNYTPDLSARAMRGRTDTVALVADDLTTPSIGMVVAAMERQARTVGAFVSVAQTWGVPERQFDMVRTLCAFRPRALVLTSSRIEGTARNARLVEELRAYERDGGRVVIYGSVDLPFDSVRFDDRASARKVGEHLAATGHRRILILSGMPDRAFAAERRAGFAEGLTRGGVAEGDIQVVECEVSRQGGYDAVVRAWSSDDPGRAGGELGRAGGELGRAGGAWRRAGGVGRAGGDLGRAGRDREPACAAGGLAGIDAIVAVNDVVAIGALSACRDLGIAVPEKLSVTGVDDIPLASDVTPRLATLALPHASSGARAVELALSGTAGREPVREVVVGVFVARESCAPRR